MIDKLDTFTMNKTTNLIIARLNEVIERVNTCECGACEVVEEPVVEETEEVVVEDTSDEEPVKEDKKGMFGRKKK